MALLILYKIKITILIIWYIYKLSLIHISRNGIWLFGLTNEIKYLP